MFSVMVNGQLEGFFPSEQGLQQGDPISPLFFVLCMEYFTRILNKVTSNGFVFHKNCSEMRLSHLRFADNLFIFSNGDVALIEILPFAIQHFRDTSGLQPNLQESLILFSSVEPVIREQIISVIKFRVGSLPVKYLGISLISTRLKKEYCLDLIARISARVLNWNAKALSYTGRLQLINFVVTSMHLYWSSVFPMVFVHEVEKICMSFL